MVTGLCPLENLPRNQAELPDCVAGHVRFELRNPCARRCGVGGTQLGSRARITAGIVARALFIELHRGDGTNGRDFVPIQKCTEESSEWRQPDEPDVALRHKAS